MKILLIGNQARSTYIFWRVLIKHLKDSGHQVICCVPHDQNNEYIKKLEQSVPVTTYMLKRKGTKAWQELSSIIELYKILREEKPDKIFSYTIKPIIYGNIAAKFAKNNNVYSCITGLGFSFEPATTLFKKCLSILVKFLYKIALHKSAGIIFQNHDDRQTFLHNSIIKPYTNYIICNGTGVDLEYFSFQQNYPAKITFLLMARLLKAKGIENFTMAAKILKQKYPMVLFQLLGPVEHGYGALSLSQVYAWQQAGFIDYLGDTSDVRPYITNASVVVLPSWREGLSCALMEAMSMGRAIVATDVPGCRELIEQGKNGFLTKPDNTQDLAAALEKFILNEQMIKDMGAQGRRMAEVALDAHVVAQQIMQYMEL